MTKTRSSSEIQAELSTHENACEYVWDNSDCPVCVDLIVELDDALEQERIDAEAEQE